MPTAAIYCRISADREGEALGVARQQQDCEALAASLDLTVTGVYVDNDISASTRSKKPRPEYERMITAAEAGEVDFIVAYSNSRLTRRPRELETLVELHQRNGVQIRTVVSGSYDLSTADGRLHARLLGSIDAAESERTAERISRASRQAAEDGRWHGGPRPFGYEADGVTVRMGEAAALRAGYRMVLSGAALAAVARRWNEEGFTTGRSGSAWSTPSVREVLCNPRNAGLRAYRGEIVGDAVWPAVVDRAQWEAARAVLRDPARRHGPKGGQRLLTGLALCGVCGGTVFSSGGTVEKPVYRCRSLGHVARQALPVEGFVEDVVVEHLRRVEALPVPEPDDGAAGEAQVLRARLESLATDFADGVLTGLELDPLSRTPDL